MFKYEWCYSLSWYELIQNLISILGSKLTFIVFSWFFEKLFIQVCHFSLFCLSFFLSIGLISVPLAFSGNNELFRSLLKGLSRTLRFAKIVNGFQLLTIFAKKLYLTCLTGFWIRFCYSWYLSAGDLDCQ